MPAPPILVQAPIRGRKVLSDGERRDLGLGHRPVEDHDGVDGAVETAVTGIVAGIGAVADRFAGEEAQEGFCIGVAELLAIQPGRRMSSGTVDFDQ